MKKYLIGLLSIFVVFLGACTGSDDTKTLRFATSAEYPPFEYIVNGKLVGFDIELGKKLAEELGKEAKFDDMQFGAILAAVQSDMVDAAIATMTITDERKKNFDFSDPYYTESLALVYPKDAPVKQASQLPGKKIACQLGTTMEIWLRKHATNSQIITTDTNPQAIESLKAGHVDAVLIDSIQAAVFSRKNPHLSYATIAKADTGYGIAFKKGSPLTEQVNKALRSLEEKGVLQALKEKYLEGKQWPN